MSRYGMPTAPFMADAKEPRPVPRMIPTSGAWVIRGAIASRASSIVFMKAAVLFMVTLMSCRLPAVAWLPRLHPVHLDPLVA